MGIHGTVASVPLDIYADRRVPGCASPGDGEVGQAADGRPGTDRPGGARGAAALPDGAFDLIVCALAIHYARDRAAAFA